MNDDPGVVGVEGAGGDDGGCCYCQCSLALLGLKMLLKRMKMMAKRPNEEKRAC